ncbi:unnamed protein product, partial [Tuber aestivum]
VLSDIRFGDNSHLGCIHRLFAGDFAQILPAIQRGSRAQTEASLQRSFLWPSLRIPALQQIRVWEGEVNEASALWVHQL